MALCAPWAEYADVCGPAATQVDETLFDRWVMPASEYLYWKTGRQFKGQCPRVVRPCAIRKHPARLPLEWGWRFGWFTPMGGGFPWGYCGCIDGDPMSGSCGCGRIPEVKLGALWVDSITEVLIDGAVVDPSTYRIDEHRLLVRTDGQQWPRTQNMVADVDQVNTFQVSYISGRPLPALAVVAAAALAAEWALACANSGNCRLPRKAASIARQGVSVQLKDVFGTGMTGLPEVDAFIGGANPKGKIRRGAVFNPDIVAAVRRTQT